MKLTRRSFLLGLAAVPIVGKLADPYVRGIRRRSEMTFPINFTPGMTQLRFQDAVWKFPGRVVDGPGPDTLEMVVNHGGQHVTIFIEIAGRAELTYLSFPEEQRQFEVALAANSCWLFTADARTYEVVEIKRPPSRVTRMEFV